MTALKDSTARSRLLYLNALRIALLGLLICVSLLVLLVFETPYSTPAILFTLSAGLFLGSLYFLLARIMSIRKLVFLELQLDILLITVLVYFSGGIVSPFYFLYILPIIVSALFLQRRDTIYMAAFAFIAFGVLSDLMYLNLIPYFPAGEDLDISLGTFIYNLMLSFFAFSGVAALSSYYFERMRQSGERLKSVEEDLRDVRQINNSVLERMDNGFLTSDETGMIISFNRRAGLLLPLEKKENVIDLLLSRDELEAILDLSADAPRHYFEREIGGRFLGISASLVEKVSMFSRLVVFLLTDLSERREIEKKLKEREHLALIGEMAAVMAHEIRNPLASISGAAQFLSREQGVSGESARLMEIIVRESNRLSSSIADFLDFSRVTPLEIENIDLAAMLDEIIDIIKLNNSGIDFVKRYNRRDFIWADRRKIRQLLWNLISNAVKAVQGQGLVELTVFTRNDKTYLAVRDDGLGMDEAELARIGQPFYSRFASGFGLGLAVVKRIVDEHGFSIEFISRKGAGTEVILCLQQERAS